MQTRFFNLNLLLYDFLGVLMILSTFALLAFFSDNTSLKAEA
jgi:hypothetical protein